MERLLIPVVIVYTVKAERMGRKMLHSSLGRKDLKIYARPLYTVLLLQCRFDDCSSAFIANIYVSN